MTRTIRLGIAVTAVLAMSAIGAAAAEAGSLDIGGTPTLLTGEQGIGTAKNKLTVTSSLGETLTTFKCMTASLEATTSFLSATELTVTPKYSGCELGGILATVNSNSCKYTLSGVGVTPLAVNFSVTSCTSTLTITQGTCVLTIPSSSETLERVTFTNVSASPKNLTANLEVKKIKVFGGTGCPANLQALGNTGDLTGTQTLKSFVDSSGVEGTQVSLEAT